jgi:hypothetical protein
MTEVRMPARLASSLFLFLVIPAVSQQSRVQQQISQRVQAHQERISQVVNATVEPDSAAAMRQAVHHDAEALSALSASVQIDLQQLRSGMLARDLNEKLKKMEKLSKKLRREMEQ